MASFWQRWFGASPPATPQPPGPIPGVSPVRSLSVPELLARLPFEARVVPRGEVTALLLRSHRERPDRHAFSLGPPQDLGLWVERLELGPPAEATLREAQTATLEAWDAEMQRDAEAVLGRFPRTEEEGEPRPEPVWPEAPVEPAPERLSWEVDAPNAGPEVVVGFAPVARSWETFAHTRFGGWNGCPPPAVHVAVARGWARDHGAVLVHQGYDTVEFAVRQPIATRAEALRVAEVHAMYGSEVLNDGVTIPEHAASLIGATSWFFWWD